MHTILESVAAGHIIEDEMQRSSSLGQFVSSVAIQIKAQHTWNTSTLSVHTSLLMVGAHGLLVLRSGQIVCLGRHV